MYQGNSEVRIFDPVVVIVFFSLVIWMSIRARIRMHDGLGFCSLPRALIVPAIWCCMFGDGIVVGWYCEAMYIYTYRLGLVF